MHELSLCLSICQIVEAARQGRTVERVDVQVGQLRQVVPETLAACWETVTATTPLQGSRLVLEQVDARLRCRRCGAATSGVEGPVLACGECGSLDVLVTAGQELAVTSIDILEAGHDG
jgi:hydrogenase nickel incorporation protein HypA/HybF